MNNKFLTEAYKMKVQNCAKGESGGVIGATVDASTPRKNPVDARRARKKSLDARRLQISLLDPYQMEYRRKSFPNSEHYYLSVSNEHANAKLVGVTKSLLGLAKKVTWGHGRGRF